MYRMSGEAHAILNNNYLQALLVFLNAAKRNYQGKPHEADSYETAAGLVKTITKWESEIERYLR